MSISTTPSLPSEIKEAGEGVHQRQLAYTERIARLGKGPLAFWFLNHELDEQELARQIRELKSKGFTGFFLHSRSGLTVPYASKSWNDIILFCVAEAKAQGMEAWLYDEDPYPSGAAGGRVTLDHPEYRASRLIVTTLQLPEEGGRVTLDLPQGALIGVHLVKEGKIERIDETAGMIRSAWRPFFSSSSYYPPHMDGSPHWRAETTSPHYRVALDASPGGGEVIAFIREFIHQSPWGEYSDILNPDAVRLFLDYTHEAYAELLGDECGTTVPGIFTDEAKIPSRFPWSPLIVHWFFEVTGENLLEILPHLALSVNERTPFYRWAFRKALAKGLRVSMFEQMAAVCAEHRLLLTGHMSPEEDPVAQVLYIPGAMTLLGKMDIPGTDLIGSAIGSRHRPLMHLSPKLASSAAHGYGKVQVACEAFAVFDWAQDFSWLTRATHWLYALGVNRLVTHGQFYSIDGLRKREAPPSQFIQASYWEHFDAFSEMVKLLSTELTKGRHKAPILLYYPEESFMAMVGGIAEGPDEAALRDQLAELAHALLTTGYDFDFADEALLEQTSYADGEIRLGDETFEVIVVPGSYITASAWAKLNALREAGAAILFLNPSITVLLAQPEKRATGALLVQNVLSSLRSLVTPLWESQGELVGHLRETEDGSLLFLCNIASDDFCGSVKTSFPGPYEVCYPQEGVWRNRDDLDLLELGAGIGVLIRQRAVTYSSLMVEEQWHVLDVNWEEWLTRPVSENCLVLSQYRLVATASEDVPNIAQFNAAPIIDLLSPTVLNATLPPSEDYRYLKTHFDWSGDPSPIRLVADSDLGVSELILYLNGVKLPGLKRRFTYDPMNREVAIDHLIVEGRNHLIWMQPPEARNCAHPLPHDGLRLFGDFRVDFPHGYLFSPRLTPRPSVYKGGFPLSPPQMGHAHYGGIVEYESTFLIKGECPHRLRLQFGHVYESMEVRINGNSVGKLWEKPYRVEFPKALLQSGENKITLRCSSSPANYLQAFQQPVGFIGPVTLLG